MGMKTIKKGVLAAAALLLFAAPTAALAEGGPEKLVPMGTAVGLTLRTQGVIVAGVGEIETESGPEAPARDAGLAPGDVILAVNGRELTKAEELAALFGTSEGEVELTVRRNGAVRQITVEPCRTDKGAAIGVFVRDELSGIGTLTFYDPETGLFGALGHAVSDSQTGEELPLAEGRLSPAAVENVTPGKPGTPGQLGGAFDKDDVLGVILVNSESGVFGELEDVAHGEPLETAAAGEIETGPATIYATVEGEAAQAYDVEIVRVYAGGDNRDLMLKVTDRRLLDKTGGIVQGMSGSPIVQNGKFVGAVTHVLISDPTRGYGISIQRMIEAAGYAKPKAA